MQLFEPKQRNVVRNAASTIYVDEPSVASWQDRVTLLRDVIACQVALGVGLALTLVLAPVGNPGVHAASPVPGARQSEPIAIIGATVHSMVAAPREATLLFVDGKISAIGEQLELPADTVRVDGSGKHLYPGLFCAAGQLGLVEINSIRATRDEAEVGRFNPNVRVEVAVNPESELIPVTRANGVLLTLAVPTGGLIAGNSAVMQLDGWTWEDMTLKSRAGMHVQWPRMSPESRWDEARSAAKQASERDDRLRELNEFFDRAKSYHDTGDEEVDLRLEAMLPVIRGEMPLIVHADSRQEIQAAVGFAAERKLKLIVFGGYDAEQCASLLKAHDVGVIVPAVYRLPRRRSDPYDHGYTLPGRLHRAGVKFCIAGAGRFGASNLRNLPYHAATAVAYGLPKEEGIRAITRYPAELLGVEASVGTLEVGKHATLIVTDGDPLETESDVLIAFIEGRRVNLSSRHEQLWQKYREKYRQLDIGAE